MQAKKKTPSHTPEPWELHVYGDKDSPQGLTAIRGGGGAEDLAWTTQKNAQRIVACVNACAGIPDPETMIPELVETLRWIRVDTLKARSHTSILVHDKARAVLAKLERGQQGRSAP